MDTTTFADIKRAVETIIHKRHDNLRHIKRAFSKQGVFWYNTVYVAAADIRDWSAREGSFS
jgi:hypothetical protein